MCGSQHNLSCRPTHSITVTHPQTPHRLSRRPALHNCSTMPKNDILLLINYFTKAIKILYFKKELDLGLGHVNVGLTEWQRKEGHHFRIKIITKLW